MKKLFFMLIALVLCLSTTQAQIVITEIMYNSAEAGTDSSEFIELYNAGSSTVDLQNYYFSAGIVDTFLISTPITAGGYVVVAFNAAYFQARYGMAPTKQWMSGALSNSGEVIVLKDGSGTVVDSVFFDDIAPWPLGFAAGQPDGGGSSLVLCNPALDNANGANWFASTSSIGMTVNTFPVTSSPFAADAACSSALQVSFASAGVTVSEGVGTVTVNVTITNPNANPTSVDVIVNGASTATGTGTDYTFTPSTLTFPASSTTNQTFTVTITDDGALEATETIVLELTNPTNTAVFGTDSLYTITIMDNDGTPELNFGATGVTVNENAGTVTVNVTITNANANPTSVDVIVNGTSTATGTGSDYSFAGTTLTFPGNSTTNQTFTVTITDDAIQEAAETIVLELTNPTNSATLGSDSLYTITISANDAPLANLVITEINYNPSGTDSIEFIEIYNNDTMTVDLAGYQLTNGIFITFPLHSLAPGQFVLACQDSAWFQQFFGMAAYQWNGSNSLNNTGEALVLRNASGDVLDSVFYSANAPWPFGTSGTGATLQLCDVNSDNANGANWGASTNPTGVFNAGVQVLATPGAANTTCPVVVPPSYTYHPISDINTVDGSGVPDSLGVLVELRGVAHCSDFNSAAALDFYIVESINVGIKAYASTTVDGYVVTEGDSLHLFGSIAQISGTTEILLDSISMISSGNGTVTPMVVSTAFTEIHEGAVIQLNNVSLVNASQWTGTGSGFNVDVSNGTTTWQVRIDNDVDLYGQAAPSGNFNVYGFGSQFDASSPYTSGYQLLACNSSITPIVGVASVSGNDNKVNLFPNPVFDVLNVRADNIESIIITNMLGQEVARVQNVNDNFTTINTAALPAGVYNVSVVSNGQLSTQQLVKG